MPAHSGGNSKEDREVFGVQSPLVETNGPTQIRNSPELKITSADAVKLRHVESKWNHPGFGAHTASIRNDSVSFEDAKATEIITEPTTAESSNLVHVEHPCQLRPSEVAGWTSHPDTNARAPIPKIAVTNKSDPNLIQPTMGLLRDFKPYAVPVATVVIRVPKATIDCKYVGLTSSGRRIYSMSKWYHQEDIIGPTIQVLRRNPKIRKFIPGKVLSLITVWSQYYQHNVFDTLSLVAAVLPMVRNDKSIIILSPSEPCTSLLVQGLNVPEHRVITTGVETVDSIYEADELLLVHHISPDSGPGRLRKLVMGVNPAGWLRHLRSELNHNLWRERSESPSTIVYLHRPFGRARGLHPDNEYELLQAVKRSLLPGYSLKVFNDSKGWLIDRHLFATAKVIFGPHGGAESNIIFSAPGTHLIEFNPMASLQKQGENARPCYLGLANSCDINYWVVQPKQFAFLGRETPTVVDVQDVVDILAAIGVSIV